MHADVAENFRFRQMETHLPRAVYSSCSGAPEGGINSLPCLSWEADYLLASPRTRTRTLSIAAGPNPISKLRGPPSPPSDLVSFIFYWFSSFVEASRNGRAQVRTIFIDHCVLSRSARRRRRRRRRRPRSVSPSVVILLLSEILSAVGEMKGKGNSSQDTEVE